MGALPPHYAYLAILNTKKRYLYTQLKINNMRKPLNLSNSIYQQKKAGPGLTMECGMMINNRPNSTTGIQKAVEIKRMAKRAEKISTMSEAVSLGSMPTCFNCMD